MNPEKRLLALEKCPRDNASRYIVIRDRKKAYSVYLLHVLKGVQAMQLLTKIPKNTLDFHDSGQSESRNLDFYREIAVQHARQEMQVVTDLLKRQERREKTLRRYRLRKSSANSESATNTVSS